MNGLEKITDRIVADAQAQAEELIAQARAQAADISGTYEDKVRTFLDAERTKADALGTQMEQRAAAAGALEGRKCLLAAKQQLLDNTFAEALRQLCSLPKEDYSALLTGLLVTAAKGGEEVVFNPADRAQVGKAVVTAANEKLKNGGLTLSGETRDIKGGFILKSGLIEVNCALETLVEQEKETMSAQVISRLFPKA